MSCAQYSCDQIHESIMIRFSKITMAEHTFTLFAHTNHEHASTFTQIVAKHQRLTHPISSPEESRRCRSLATICGVAARKRKFVWRRGQGLALGVARANDYRMFPVFRGVRANDYRMFPGLSGRMSTQKCPKKCPKVSALRAKVPTLVCDFFFSRPSAALS